MNSRKFLLAAGVAAALAAFGSTTGAEEVNVGGSGDADARLDFQVNVPGVLRFRVGSTGSTIDEIVFDPTASDLETDNTSVAGSGGDQTGGAVTVEVFSNRGQVTIAENNDGGGTGLSSTTTSDNISYSRIDTTSSDSGNLPAPTLSDSGGNTAQPALSGSNFTDRSATWTYTFDASNLDVAPGTYEGRVTYTASAP